MDAFFTTIQTTPALPPLWYAKVKQLFGNVDITVRKLTNFDGLADRQASIRMPASCQASEATRARTVPDRRLI